MKHLLVITIIWILAFRVPAQNVGIHTINPQATLDVKGNLRVGGNSSYLKFDSTTGKIEWTGASLFVPVSQQIISHSASAEGMYAGGGKFEYRNRFGNPVFFTEWATGNGYFGGSLGIGNLNAQFPLSFNGTLGDKISLWTDGSATHYGLGIQAGLFQVFSKTVVDDIAFGYGSSNSFTENMRIRGNGNVGIGNSAPQYRLDISDRIRIRSGGTDGTSAGLWLNNKANNETAFFGMEDDSHVGLYGATAGWRFGMNTQTGALKINGSEGQAGQLLQSNGNAAPEWKNNPVNDIYNLTEELVNTGGINVVSGTEGVVPGLTKTLVLTKPSKVIIQFMVFSGSVSCTFCSGTTFDIVIFLDGNNTGRIRNSVGNGEYMHVTGTRISTLPAGTHTIQIVGRNLSGPDLTMGQVSGNAYPSFLTLQVIPQN